MCLLNYNKENKKYKHLTYTERTMIERWYNREHLSSKKIAQRLDKSERTIRRELKRGLTTVLNTYLEEIEVYSADIANDKYLFNLKAKGKNLKIGSDIELVRRIESMIKEEKKSPEVVAYELKEGELIDITGKTIRNYIKDGTVLDIDQKDMIYNKEHKNKEKRIAKHTPPEKSIEYRLKEANMRSEYGHWEGDLIIGKRTEVYYAHPYCSREKGSNENNNRMIRRWIPKGTIIDNITTKHIKEIENWLNNYPRAMFDYKSSNMLLLNI